MTRHIRPLTEDDLPDLNQFLVAGFQAAPGADFAAIEVLRWKYLERHGPANRAAITGGIKASEQLDASKMSVTILCQSTA